MSLAPAVGDDLTALALLHDAIDKPIACLLYTSALDEDCDFVHLGQGDLDGADIAALRAKGVRLGVSTHDEAELDRALSLSPDYIALGPIYPCLLYTSRKSN